VVCEVHHPHQSFVSVDRNVAPQSLTGHTANVVNNAKRTMNDSLNREKSFRMTILAIIMVVIAIIFVLINKNKHDIVFEYLSLVLLFIAPLFSIIGIILGLKKLKEKKTKILILSMIMNLIILTGFFTLLIFSIITISKIEH
jgi:cytochrome bd-type quinol oxidase subunit 2